MSVLLMLFGSWLIEWVKRLREDLGYWKHNAKYTDFDMKYGVFLSTEWDDYDRHILKLHIITKRGHLTDIEIPTGDIKMLIDGKKGDAE